MGSVRPRLREVFLVYKIVVNVTVYLYMRLLRIYILDVWRKNGAVTSAVWQVTLCDPIWHVNSRSGEVKLLLTATPSPKFTFYLIYLCIIIIVHEVQDRQAQKHST